MCADAYMPTYTRCLSMSVHTILFVYMCLHACVHTPVCVCVELSYGKGNSTPTRPGDPLALALSICHLQGHRGQLALSSTQVPPLRTAICGQAKESRTSPIRGFTFFALFLSPPCCLFFPSNFLMGVFSLTRGPVSITTVTSYS